MKAYYLEDGSKILVDDTKPIGSGGEGSVFKLQKNPNILVKIYADRALERMPDIEHKIKAMVKKKPGLLDYNGLTIIAWPSYVIYNENKRFVGYLMKRVQAKNQLSHVITPGLQKAKFPNITWYDRLVISINLAKVTSFLHKNDTVIGDINTSDFFVYPGFEIGVVDTDSFQVTSENGLFHCKVFTPDYTPPEVIEAKKRTSFEIKRIPNHDNYGIAILIFQILMMGVHPFSARIKGIMGFDGNAINYNMEKEIFPYFPYNPSIMPPKNAMPFSFFPKYIQDLFIRAFDKNKHVINRPTSDEWVNGLRQLKDHLKKCRRDKSHFYPDHFQKCPHCARESSKDYDFLLEHFKTISRKYVTYETDYKPIIVDENHVYDETIVSKSYTLKKGKDLAIFFNPKMLDKYQLEERIKALKVDPSYQKLRPYIDAPKALIFDPHKPKIIGYVSQHREPLYRLSQFLKNNRLGKMKITEKTKIMIAKNIAAMFHAFEKQHVTVEFSQIFIDKNLNPYIPDIVLLKTSDLKFAQMSFQKEEYLPQEYYLMQKYQAYQHMLEAEKEKIKEQERKRIEAERQKDLELIKSPFEKEKEKKAQKLEVKEAVLKVDTEPKETDFEFEKSLKSLIEEKTEEKTLDIPLNITFDPYSKQSIYFDLSVIIHYILHDAHPFSGTYKLSHRSIPFFVENNYYLHKKETDYVDILEKTKPIELYPLYYQKAMKQSLYVKDQEKIQRTTALQWQNILTRLTYETKKCETNEYHDYHQSLTACPLCFRDKHASIDDLRQYILDHKRGIVHHMLVFNKIFNYTVLSLMMLGMIYLVNTYPMSEFNQLLTDIGFEQKLDQVKAFLRIEQIGGFLENTWSWIKGIYDAIFGGAS
ncbi:MAG: hypothetical protein CVV61_00115 [Tenericutes bacterium HGW-Tenericutes-6]|nr:MAG: hypothetical protein CVV61_00115 [Tenericutes bacterium HGW-Tenericutes-6]